MIILKVGDLVKSDKSFGYVENVDNYYYHVCFLSNGVTFKYDKGNAHYFINIVNQ